jgi:hypothetical protein
VALSGTEINAALRRIGDVMLKDLERGGYLLRCLTTATAGAGPHSDVRLAMDAIRDLISPVPQGALGRVEFQAQGSIVLLYDKGNYYAPGSPPADVTWVANFRMKDGRIEDAIVMSVSPAPRGFDVKPYIAKALGLPVERVTL